jgi:hypothetical protein
MPAVEPARIWNGLSDSRRMSMRVKLEQRWIKRLLQLPESGMGYQRVDLRLADGRELKNVLAFNAEEVELPDECANAKIEDVHLRTA